MRHPDAIVGSTLKLDGTNGCAVTGYREELRIFVSYRMLGDTAEKIPRHFEKTHRHLQGRSPSVDNTINISHELATHSTRLPLPLKPDEAFDEGPTWKTKGEGGKPGPF